MSYQDHIIFSALVGSQAYGTSTPESDEDIKSIGIQSIDEILVGDFLPQIEISKDNMIFEIGRFIELLIVANPTAIELLFTPDDCVIKTTKYFEILREHKNIFLTKRCKDSFGNYAMTQIKKAKGLDKMMNWEKQRMVRKKPIDFCHVYLDGKTVPLEKYLNDHNMKNEYCGVVALNHFKDSYSLYYDPTGDLKYHGIFMETSNEVRLSSIPKNEESLCIFNFNKDGYSKHCSDYSKYKNWLDNRNTNRYTDTTQHGQKIDGKNLLHCRRLLDIAKEIADTGTLSVKRPNAADLLKIRRGEFSLEQIIDQAYDDAMSLGSIYDKSTLPENVDHKLVKSLLLNIRKEYYQDTGQYSNTI